MIMNLYKLSTMPLKLKSNRVWRSYKGGMLIETWQGKPSPQDGEQPEEWVASVVEARNKNEVKDEGLSLIELEDGNTVKLADVIRGNCEGFLGKSHMACYGYNTAVLAKVLDSAVRLSIQVHPDKAYAREVFDSAFGKTESWYVIGGREVGGEPPYVLLGFKEGMTRKKWKAYFDQQDTKAMVDSLHKFYIKPGDVFLVEGGIPHAIGSGCFLIEVQEPTDYTMRIERVAFDGGLLPEKLCHQGVGFEKMLDCFHYEGLSREVTLQRWYKAPRIIRAEEGGLEVGLITREDTPCFSMYKLSVRTRLKNPKEDGFQIAILLNGKGHLRYEGGSVNIQQGDMFFLPAGVRDIVFENTGEADLEVMICLPPVGTMK